MRRAFVLSLLFVSTSAFAQQKNSFSVFVTNPGGGYTQASGTTFNAGLGIDYQRLLTEHWAADLSVARENYSFRAFSTTGGPQAFSTKIFPVDMTARYTFFTSSRFRPYVGGGLRYVHDNGVVRSSDAGLKPKILGGLSFYVTPRFSIFGDVKQGFDNRTGPTSIGLRFGF